MPKVGSVRSIQVCRRSRRIGNEEFAKGTAKQRILLWGMEALG
jgi:hypothetical protein